MDLARLNINTGRRMVSEGLSGILTIDQLKKAKPAQLAHGTGPILEEYFSTPFPYHDQITGEKIGSVGGDFEYYKKDFKHMPGWLAH